MTQLWRSRSILLVCHRLVELEMKINYFLVQTDLCFDCLSLKFSRFSEWKNVITLNVVHLVFDFSDSHSCISKAIFIEKRLASLHIEYTRAPIWLHHLIDPYDSYHETNEFVWFVIIYESTHTSMSKEKWKSVDKFICLQKSTLVARSLTSFNQRYHI